MTAHAFSRPKTKTPIGPFVTVHQEADRLDYDDKANVMRLYGHVKLTQADTVLLADQAVYYLNKEEAEAGGHLKLTSREGTLTGSHLHVYYRQQRAVVDGGVRLDRAPGGASAKEEPVTVTAGEIDYRWGEKAVTAQNGMTLIQGSRRVSANRGVYEEGTQRVVMDGSVHLVRPPKDEMWCDHLVYNLKTNQSSAEGHVRGKFSFHEAKGEPKPSEPPQNNPDGSSKP